MRAQSKLPRGARVLSYGGGASPRGKRSRSLRRKRYYKGLARLIVTGRSDGAMNLTQLPGLTPHGFCETRNERKAAMN